MVKTQKTKLAANFAAAAHKLRNHRRKYTNDPYIVHPAEVAKLVSMVCFDEDVICAAWLHDVVEDTVFTLDNIHCLFGARVAALVEQLTDIAVPSDGNRKVRAEINRNHTAVASKEAKMVKLADLISNTKSIVEHDPDFARVYLKEKELLLEVLQDADSQLYYMASQSLINGKLKLMGD